MRTVLDASAVLAALLREPGAERVGDRIDAAVVSAVNFAEIAAALIRNGASAVEVRAVLKVVGLTVIPADEELAVAAGLLRPVTDRAGLARQSFLSRSGEAPRLPGAYRRSEVASIAEEVGVEMELIR